MTKDKVSLIGYSEGTAVSTYALSIEPDYFEERVRRVIMLAPTIYFKHNKQPGLQNAANKMYII